jgi:hypothetical protein
MKKSPEKDLWNSLRSRLGNYTEEPGDDSWEKIASAIPQQTESLKGLIWIDRAVGLGLLLLLSFISGYVVRDNEADLQKTEIAAANLENALQPDSRQKDISTQTEISATTSINNHSIAERNRSKLSEVPDSESSNLVADKVRSGSKNNQQLKAEVIVKNEETESSSQLNNSEVIDAAKLFFERNIKNEEGNNVGSVEVDSRQEEGLLPLHADKDLANKDISPLHADKIQTQNSNQDSLDNKVKRTEPKETVATLMAKSTMPIKMKKASQSQIYFAVTPLLSFQKITPSTHDDVVVSAVQSPGIFSKSRFGISIDAGLQRQLTRHLEFYAGLSFYQQHQQIAYVYQTSEVTITPSSDGSYSIVPVTDAKEFNYSMVNAGASTGLFYRIMGYKLVHKLGVGVQYHKGMLRADSEESYRNAQSSYFNYQLMYRMEFKINKTFNGFFQPTFTHTIRASEKLSEPFTIKQYRAGIGVGILYHF